LKQIVYVVVVVCFLLLYACYARNRGYVLQHKNVTQRNAVELITCWKITLAGKKANPALRVNPDYNG
jgi:hypothetical protein